MISEKVQLIGKGLYKDIPDQLTIKALPTSSELDMVGSEDFEQVMLDKILPQAVEEKINFRHLLEIDFHWLCRCLRITNYGPYYSTNMIFCGNCGKTHRGEYRVDLRTVDCKPLPEGFVNNIVISKDEFVAFDKDITIQLATIQEMLNARNDKAFQIPGGKVNVEYARICYMIKSIGNQTNLTPVQVKMMLDGNLSAADYILLKDTVNSLCDYGLRAGGRTSCPVCGSKEAAYVAFVDDRFFRPTVGDLREWKHSRSTREDENISGSETATL